MQISLTTEELKKFVGTQLDVVLPDKTRFIGKDVDSAFDLALERVEYCFKFINNNAYQKEGEVYFSHLHTDQYSQFLFFLSNSLWNISSNKVLCDKLIVLNRILNGMFFSYKCHLPNIFLFDHPVGTVIGNAEYSDFLVISQNVTIETNYDSKGKAAPKLGKGLFLSSGAKIIGNKTIGDRVSIGADVLIFKEEIPSDMVVYKDRYGCLQMRKRHKRARAQVYFNVDIK